MNLPLGAEYDPHAPWNEKDDETTCPECGTEMEYWDSGIYRRHEWTAYKCFECGHIESDEPDYE
jgi:predicted RNA-binding Zn-ribbon protein involved in translation (DUF1610 family)